MGISELIEKVLNNYLKEKMQPTTKNNKLAKLLRRGLNSCISEDVLGGKIQSRGSAGQSNWANVPWIGVFDKDISISAEAGFDIVYLFSPDMEDVYLSLNQGWTFFKNNFGRDAKRYIRKVSVYWQNTLKARSKRMTSNSIDLTSGLTKNLNLPRGYELGNILSIRYKKGFLPSDKQMLQDLKDMMFCLIELKNDLLNSNDIQQSIRYILSLSTINNNNYQISNKIKRISSKLSSLKLQKPKRIFGSSNFTGKKVDFNRVNANNSQLGFLGELIVLGHEKKKLKDFPILKNKIEHVSQTKGDGLGYDILSFDEKGHKMYIEVKTTTQDKDAPFFASKNELEFSKTHKQNYFLYRIFNFDELEGSNNVEFFQVKGDISRIFHLTPINYMLSL